ncbi:MAG: IS66 family transposase [Thermoleophilaceae bacterium]|nr:IS66 family transposase [Thermoleophilaceae bacterium]
MAIALANIDYKSQLETALLTLEAQRLTIEGLQLEILQLKKLIFGSRHEKFIGLADQNAPTLFDVTPIAEVITTGSTTVSYQKKTTHLQSNHKGRNGLPENLRREEQIINPDGIDLATAKKLGEDVSETLAYKPCELFVKKVVRPRLLDITTHRIFQAPAPERSFERSNVDTSLVAQVIVEKYVDHLPLYRQLNRYLRLGVSISDSTMGDWLTTASKLLLPLYQAHALQVLSSGYLHADETIIKVLDNDKKQATHQGYYWVYQCHEQKLVLFDYRTGRGCQGPQSILENYQGYLQTDGYGAYDDFANKAGIILLGCMAHARRKFSQALSNNNKAAYVLTEIQKLYAIERHLTDNAITGEQKLQYRKENAIPLLNALGIWMQQAYTEVLPGSAFGKALFYSLHRWGKLSLYANTAILNIDNNPVENSIRPVAIGRKNYLFAGSHAAAQRAAMFYSLLATCKNLQINPYDWLHDVLNRIAAQPINRIKKLLPQNWIPDTS